MKLKNEFSKTSTNEVTYIFSVTEKNFEEAKELAYEKTFKADFSAKGFRKGQAPLSIFIKEKGIQAIQTEAMQVLFEEGLKQIVSAKETEIVGSPKVDFEPAINQELKCPFTFKLVCPVKPEVKLGKYKGLELETLNINITDKEVNDEIKKELDKATYLQPVKEGSEAKEGNTITFDFEGFVDGKPFEGGKAEKYDLKLGSKQFIPGFEEQLVGMKVNEEKDIKVVFPKEYGAKNLAGKDAIFKCKVFDIKEEKKPKLDDEFVKSLNIKNCSNVIEYKEHVKKELTTKAEDSEKARVKDLLSKQAGELAQMEIHPQMIEYDVERRIEEMEKQAKQYNLTLEMFLKYQGMDLAKYREDVKKFSQEFIRTLLTLEEIVKVEKLVASKEEVDEFIMNLAKNYNMAPAEVRKHMDEKGIALEVQINKALDLIVKNAKLTKVDKLTKQAKTKK